MADIPVVQSDWNAKVDPYAYQHWAGTVRRFCIGKTNERGWRVLEFAKSHRLTLTISPVSYTHLTLPTSDLV